MVMTQKKENEMVGYIVAQDHGVERKVACGFLYILMLHFDESLCFIESNCCEEIW